MNIFIVNLYHHALFYNRYNKNALDLKKSEEEYRDPNSHPVASIRNILGDTEKSNLPLEALQELGKALAKKINERLEENRPHDGGFDEAKEMFEKEGLLIERPVGIGKEGDRDTVCTLHDGIRYHLYLMKSSSHSGVRNQDKATEEANDYKSMIDKYHPTIKQIHDKFKSEYPDMENLWVMEGGGAQHQAFFGNEGGYIATLYLGMKNSKKSSKDLTLVFNGYEDEPKWQIYKDFEIERVDCRAFGKTDEFKEERAKYE